MRGGWFRPWVLWSALTTAVAVFLGIKLMSPKQDKSLFLPGKTTHGHFQIELACAECHEQAFSDTAVLQSACERCHQAELKASEDSHPAAKFRDPRNASRVKVLDARECVTCHREHQPELTHAMGLTLPEDYCYRCHEDIGDDRPSHRGLGFDTCASAGCHNFHDNRSLYEDFLVEHAKEPPNLDTAQVLALAETATKPLAQSDIPARKALPEAEQQAFLASAHAKAGVNCGKCHGETQSAWQDKPGLQTCSSCHDKQVDGWKGGRHGMRLAAGLTPMATDLARLPMKSGVGHTELSCSSCHKPHGYDTRFAATEACQGCHDDQHTKNYDASKHAQLWKAELNGEDKAGTGVSCATCHLPRVKDGEGRVYVQHNQNDTLRPNEKMVRPVCSNCHGIPFAIDALADAKLVELNFQGQPQTHIQSVDMAVARVNR